jgi:hypothetical protein
MSEKVDPLFNDFLIDSRFLTGQMKDLLETVQQDPDKQKSLGDFSNVSDRIMGAARSFGRAFPEGHPIHVISDCTSFLKKIAKNMVEIDNTDQFFMLCMNLLLETTTIVELLFDKIDQPMDEIRKLLPAGLNDRLMVVYNQFSETAVAVEMNQSEIDELMKKLNG